jgi:hypothetical protein
MPHIQMPAPPHVPVHDVDILFALDNTVGPASLAELKARFPEVAKILDDFGKSNPAHYHIGVVTSDLGAGQFTLGGGQCRPGGDGGKLQPLGAAHDPSCQAPTGGLNFIDYDQIHTDASGNPTTNLPSGQDLATTFGCVASVGDKGCGFEHQLESVYRALHDPPPDNHDFLRPDALLAVFWLTDEDDCSADPNTDLFDPAKTAQYGPLLSFRCTQYGVACGDPAMTLPYAGSAAPLTNCHPATAAEGGKLFEASRYIDLFTKPKSQGGLKDDPRNVILAAISAPSAPFEPFAAQTNPVPPGPYAPCDPPDGKTCDVVLQHSCIAPANTQFFGDPAVRLNAVVSAVSQNQLTSLCDTSYQGALQSFAKMIVSSVGPAVVGP